MSGFVKLYGSITSSSVWSEPSDTRIVWVTMLAEADQDGIVGASLPGLARFANVTLEAAEKAIATFLAPDPYSRTPDNDGRRVEVVDGGWRLLNHQKYRDMRSSSQVAEAERKAAWRETKKAAGRVPDVPVTEPEIQTDAEGEADAYTDSTTTTTPTTAEVEETLETVAALFPKPAAALAMLRGMIQGMGTAGMRSVDADTLYEAGIELSASEGDVTPHRFKIFVNKIIERRARVVAENPRSRIDVRRKSGTTLAAGKLIQKVRANRNPQFPSSVLPGWRDQLSEAEADVAVSIGLSRILNDLNEGTLVAQLAKALEDAA